MNTAWPHDFRERMQRFEGRREPQPGEVTVSIKLRVNSGCFHREHSPRAYQIIDERLRALAKADTELAFQEHETGPEVLTYVLLATAGLSLVREVVGLITEVIKARSEGIKKGDHPRDPLHLIVRRVHEREGVRDEEVLLIGHTHAVDELEVLERLTTSVRKLFGEGGHAGAAAPKPAKKKARKPPLRKKSK
jgi:hypothetical protein